MANFSDIGPEYPVSAFYIDSQYLNMILRQLGLIDRVAVETGLEQGFSGDGSEKNMAFVKVFKGSVELIASVRKFKWPPGKLGEPTYTEELTALLQPEDPIAKKIFEAAQRWAP